MESYPSPRVILTIIIWLWPLSPHISFHSSLHTRLVTFGSVSLSLLPSRAEPNETGMEWNETRVNDMRSERAAHRSLSPYHSLSVPEVNDRGTPREPRVSRT